MILAYKEKLDPARNPNTPTNVLELLANDRDYYVRHNVIHCVTTPLYISSYILYKDYLRSLELIS